MPPAIEYIEDQNAAAARELNDAAQKERETRAKNLELKWRYYKGEMTAPLKPDGTGVNDNVLLPLVRLIIDKAVANMLGVDDTGGVEGIRFLIPESEVQDALSLKSPTAETPLQAPLPALPRRNGAKPKQTDDLQDWMDRFWRANHKNSFLHGVFLNAALGGHVFIQINPNQLIDPDTGSKSLPRLVNLNPALCTPFWQEDDVQNVLWYRVDIGDDYRGKRTDYVKVSDSTWMIYTYTRKGSKWERSEAPKKWGFSFAPIIDWQNIPVPSIGGYYGLDDVGTLWQMNDALNVTVSTMQRIQKNHAMPRTVVTGGSLPRKTDGEGNETVDITPSTVLEFDDPQAKMYNLELQSDGAGSFALMQFIQRHFFNAAKEVDPATVADKLGDLTNFGLRVMYQDVLAKRQTKWMTAGEGLQRVCAAALEVAGKGRDIQVKVVPPDVLPNDPVEESTALRTDVEVFGVSQETALERRGYDPDEEKKRQGMKQRREIVGSRRLQLQQQADQALAFEKSPNGQAVNEPAPTA
jgi:hypothetical protein